MSNIVITGHLSGLGKELAETLRNDGHEIFGMDIADGWEQDVRNIECCDAFALGLPDKIDVLINNAAVNYIDYIENFTDDQWDAVMGVNAKGIFNMTRALLDQLNGGTIINIVSNAAHMPMTASLAYNASKGAAHIMTLQLARELFPRHGITVFGIAPNKLAGTGMSDSIDSQCCRVRGWTMEETIEYQKKSLKIGEETDPKVLAEFIAFLLSKKQNHKYLHSTIIPYGA